MVFVWIPIETSFLRGMESEDFVCRKAGGSEGVCPVARTCMYRGVGGM